MITGKHIRAARGWLGWSQKDLAERAGLAENSVRRYEDESVSPTNRFLRRIISAFALENVELTEDGIRHQKQIIHVTDDFLDVLNDAQSCLKPGNEILFHCASETRNTPEVTVKFAELVNSGLNLRFTIPNGDTVMTTSRDNYRWIDPDLCKNSQVSVTYKDRYVFHVTEKDRDVFVTVINRELADSMKRHFYYFWERGEISCPEAQGRNTTLK